MQKNGGLRASVGISPAKKRVVYPLLYFIFCYFILLSIPGKGTSTPKRVTTRHSSGGCHIIGQKHPSVNIPFTDFFSQTLFSFFTFAFCSRSNNNNSTNTINDNKCSSNNNSIFNPRRNSRMGCWTCFEKMFLSKKNLFWFWVSCFLAETKVRSHDFFPSPMFAKKQTLFSMCRSHCGSYLNLATVIILVTIFRHRLSVYRSSKFRGI